MPELPDVEIFRRNLEASSLNKKVSRVEVKDKKILHNTTEKQLNDLLAGKKFMSSKRHGKYLLVQVDQDKELAFHFGMTGKFKFLEEGKEIPNATHLLIHFNDHHMLAYIDKRKIGRVEVVKSEEELIKEHQLAQDALEISWEEFYENFKDKKSFLKAGLMDQGLIAGIGNVYADEILYQARLHPKGKFNELSTQELKTIYEKIRIVLTTAIECGASRKELPAHFIIPHRKEGEKCPYCESYIERLEIGGRATFFCPGCQKK
ncbi:MAG TPA: DNA-formamidopyrimidine glycosylase [Cytophagaceae bacterium]